MEGKTSDTVYWQYDSRVTYSIVIIIIIIIMYEPTQQFSVTVGNVSTQRLSYWRWCIRRISNYEYLLVFLN